LNHKVTKKEFRDGKMVDRKIPTDRNNATDEQAYLPRKWNSHGKNPVELNIR